jgi:pyruvate dehydrogenase E1 component alpha subunit
VNKKAAFLAVDGSPPAPASSRILSDEQLLWIFETAIKTRLFEDRIIRWSKEGGIPPLLHPGAGQEVAQLAALSALQERDPLLYAHRGLAYIVGRGVPLTAILADAAGREGGTNNGKGGLMHIVDLPRGVYGESGTLGGGFVIATGMGMAIRKQRRSEVVVHFFGDGTSNRGTFHESLNWSSLQKLPIIFICENNGWAVSVPTSASTAVKDIAVRAAGYDMPGVIVEGADPEGVASAVAAAAERARSGGGPTLIEIKSVRLLGHYATDPQDYREERNDLGALDPVAMLRTRLIDQGLVSDAAIADMERRLSAEIEAAVDTVKSAPLLDGSLALTDVYA